MAESIFSKNILTGTVHGTCVVTHVEQIKSPKWRVPTNLKTMVQRDRFSTRTRRVYTTSNQEVSNRPSCTICSLRFGSPESRTVNGQQGDGLRFPAEICQSGLMDQPGLLGKN